VLKVVASVGVVRGAIGLAGATALLCEGLGAVGAFSRGPVAAGWLVMMAGGAAWLAAAARRTSGGLERSRLPSRGTYVAFIGVVLALCWLTALLAPPSNGDVLSYHLPRVRHWIQNRSFAHYPTHTLRQISFPPGPGYFVATLQLLSGGDRFANLPQWLAFAGSIAVSAGLSRRIFGPRAFWPTAFLCATVPMAILQSTTAQSDLLAAFWLLCFVALVFERQRYGLVDAVWLGGALGIGMATKTTMLLFASPFVLVLAIRARRAGRRSAFVILAVVALVAALPVLPHGVRNLRTFGSLLGPSFDTTLARRDPPALLSNVLRHVVLSYPSIAVWDGVAWLHAHVLHIDPSATATTFPDTAFIPELARRSLSVDENFAASPFHVTIVLVGAVTALTVARRRGGRATRRFQLPIALALSFALYCAAVRWQPWANRLLLPLLLVATPLGGWVLTRVSSIKRKIFAFILGATALMYCLLSARHPLIAGPAAPSIWARSRGELYFADDDLAPAGGKLRGAYEELLRQARAKGCTRVALRSREFEPEYLVWITLDRLGASTQLRNARVDNVSRHAREELPGEAACAEIVLRDGFPHLDR
jgi:4-amino-4-deoxy-L-arabinose transferase-like glycosyltransferase